MRLNKTPEQNPQIRWLIRSDMPEVMEIENRCFANPWTEREFMSCLKHRNVIGTVYDSDRGFIHGFMIYELHQTMLRLLNIAVAPEVQRTGVGSKMVNRLIEKLSQQRRYEIQTEVPERNITAQCFFASAGFKAISILKRQCAKTKEDLYLFRYAVPQQPVAVDGSNRISQYFAEEGK